MTKTQGTVNAAVAPFISGRRSSSQSDRELLVVNPSTGRPIFSIPEGCDADVDHAVTAARQALDDGRWLEAPPSARKQIMHRLADLIAKEAGALDALDAGEMGKPISTIFCNSLGAAGLARFYAESIDKITGDVFSSDKHSMVVQRRVPRGVIGAVVPWNFPAYCAVLKVAPALAAGNCVVLKPSEMSSRSALRIAELAVEAGLPPGVFNVVPGKGETVGRALALHRGVDMLTFTGSTEVGKLMQQYAGQSNMKPVMLECGGKSPHIVFADGVDPDAVAGGITRLLLTNQGQVCSVGSRLLVERSIEREVIERIVEHFGAAVMGDPLDAKTTFGPIASEKQRDRVIGFVEGASRDGAERVTGGRKVLDETGGYFLEPALFRNVAPKSRIAQEEIFGPVLAVTAFDHLAEAIQLANGTAYGLSAYVWTAKLSTAMKMAKGVRSTIRVNAAAPIGEGAGYAGSGEPMGESGFGPEGGLAGMESYLRRQRVWFSHD